jgi:hypothetical protein
MVPYICRCWQMWVCSMEPAIDFRNRIKLHGI